LLFVDQFPNKKQKRDSCKEKEETQLAAQSEAETIDNLADSKEKLEVSDKINTDDVSMEMSNRTDDNAVPAAAAPSTPAAETVAAADTVDEHMESPESASTSDKLDKTSVPSSDDETELEDELEPTPKRNKKSANKKTAQDRVNEDRKRRLSTLLTMESYIHSIFSIIKRDANTSSSAANKEAPSEDLPLEASTSAAAAVAIKTKPKGASTPPEPEDEQDKYNIEMVREMYLQSPLPNKFKSNGQDQETNKFDESLSATAAVVKSAVSAATSSSVTGVASTSQAASPTQI